MDAQEPRLCEKCGEPFTPRPRRAGRFCSLACYHAAGRPLRKDVVASQRMRLVRDHPLSTSPNSRVGVSRLVLYDKIGPGPHRCHWCQATVDWMPGKGPVHGALLADHLNWDRNDDSPDNLVPSCNQCNSHRTRKGDRRRIAPGEPFIVLANGLRTRAIERTCEACGVAFLAIPAFVRAGNARFCSRDCALVTRFRPRSTD